MSVTIFEGPDGAGKTMLADTMERIVARREANEPLRYNHGPYLNQVDVADEYLKTMLPATIHRVHPLLDRSWISESIYGPIARGVNRIDVAQRRALERLALGCGAVVILCMPSCEACERAYLKRRDLEYLTSEHMLRRVYDAFSEIAQRVDEQVVPTFLYNYERETSRVLYLDLVYECRNAFTNLGPGVGLFRKGTTLIVGEQVSTTTAAAMLPWMSWDPRGCVGWFSEQLESWGVSERDLYWINALDTRGQETVAGAWLERLAPGRVISLGQVAAAWTHKHRALLRGSRLYDYPHPQHWKRFHHNEPYMAREAFE